MNTIYLLAAFLVAQVTSNDPGDAVPARTAVVAQIPVGVSPDTTVLRIPENSAAGTDIGFVSPSNTDRGGKQTYAIVSGNDGDVFSIDPQTGRLSVKNGAPLDFETHPRFQLGIETKTTANQEDDLRKSFAAQLKRSGADDATVAKMLEKVSKSVISIELTNVNEPPVLTHQTWTVRTDVPTGTIFGKLSATDPDAGDRLQFSIPEEITERFFTVEPDTGEVAVRDSAAIQSALDGLPIGGFVAEFQVTDAAGSTSVAKFPLTFEAPAAPTSPIEQVIPETAATETSPQEATQSSTEEAVPVQPGVSTVETAEVLTVQNEPPVEASSGVSFWTILNMLTFLVLLGAGFYLYRWSRSLSGSAGREFSEERRLAETARTFDASSVEQERSQLAELKASLDVRAHNLATANDELEGRTRELDAHQQELAEMAATLDARADQLARQSDELEAQRAELLESSGRIEAQKGRIETEARRLAELEAELKRQQLELTDRVLQLPSAQSMEEHQSLATIEATEKLVSIAAGNVEEAAEPESEEVLALRHQLADMFGVTDSTLARHRTVRDHEFDGIVKADDRELARSEPSPGTQLETSLSTAVTEAPADASGSGDTGHESIDSYMRDLLERQRGRQQYGSSAPLPDLRESSRVATSFAPPRTTESAIVPAPVTAEPLPEKPVSTTPIHPQDKDAVRNDLASLRTVANQAARSAVLAHTKKKFRNHSVIKISCAAASFLIAGIVLSTSFTSVLGWAAAGIGGIMLVDLGYWAYTMRQSEPGRANRPQAK